MADHLRNAAMFGALGMMLAEGLAPQPKRYVWHPAKPKAENKGPTNKRAKVKAARKQRRGQ